MESFPFFFKIRAIAFMSIMLFSFLWLVLLCVESFARWSVSDQISRSLMLLFILTNTISLIMVPFLMLVEFRAWLDAARLHLLFVLQAGSAVAGTYWSPRIKCHNQIPDDISVCQLIGVYTLIACWIIPAILVIYSLYFAIVVYLQSRIPVVVTPKHCPNSSSTVDLESDSTDSLALWREKLREITGRGSDTSLSHQQPSFPSMPQAGPSSQPWIPEPNTARRQTTMPSLPHTRSPSALPPLSSRHQSLPAFKHGRAPHLRPLTIPRPLISNISISQPQTPYTPSSSSGGRSLGSGPSVPNAQHASHLRESSRNHFTSSPREMENAEGSPTTPRSSRARLSKPLPARFM